MAGGLGESAHRSFGQFLHTVQKKKSLALIQEKYYKKFSFSALSVILYEAYIVWTLWKSKFVWGKKTKPFATINTIYRPYGRL